MFLKEQAKARSPWLVSKQEPETKTFGAVRSSSSIVDHSSQGGCDPECGRLDVRGCQESFASSKSKIVVKDCPLFSAIFKEVAMASSVKGNIVLEDKT